MGAAIALTMMTGCAVVCDKEAPAKAPAKAAVKAPAKAVVKAPAKAVVKAPALENPQSWTMVIVPDIQTYIKQIENHEKRNRKGDYMGKGWRDDFDAMARKTVYRKLIGKWGVMSIDYQNHGEGEALANQMQEEYKLESGEIDGEYTEIDSATGEVIESESEE